jgi:phage gpG-like protein
MSEYAGIMAEGIEFEWAQPDDALITANALDQLANDLRDLTPVLEGAKEIVLTDVENHFHEERGPSGDSWAEWSDSYRPVAERNNIGKLRREATQHLYEAATDRSAYRVDGNDMFIDTSGFPVYWAIQQYGGLIMSGGTLIRRYGMRRRNEAGASQHGRIPARPYLGMSEEAKIATIALFDQWVSGEIIGWSENRLRGPGAMQPRMRTGQYGKMGIARR